MKAAAPGGEPRLLDWARRLQAIAQSGLAYVRDPYDAERYEAVRRIAAEIAAELGNVAVERVEELFALDVGYATPKIDVRGVVFDDGRILLVRERADGGWTLPGGWADSWRSPRESVELEVAEESGFTVAATKLLAVYDRRVHGHTPPMPFGVYKVFFRCEITGGAPRPSIETSDVGFFPEDALPPFSRGRVVPSQIARMFEHLRDPSLATDFD